MFKNKEISLVFIIFSIYSFLLDKVFTNEREILT